MLPQDYKFHIVNKTGVQLDFSSNSANEKADLDFTKWKRDANNDITYDSETNLALSSDVANDGSDEFTAQDNSTDKYEGLFGRLTIETDNASADGYVQLYAEWTGDGGTTFPSDAADFDPEKDLVLLGSLEIVGDGAGYVRSMPFAFEL